MSYQALHSTVRDRGSTPLPKAARSAKIQVILDPPKYMKAFGDQYRSLSGPKLALIQLKSHI